MNRMLHLNHKIVKKLKREVEGNITPDSITERDMLWINQLSGRGIITPVKVFRGKF